MEQQIMELLHKMDNRADSHHLVNTNRHTELLNRHTEVINKLDSIINKIDTTMMDDTTGSTQVTFKHDSRI